MKITTYTKKDGSTVYRTSVYLGIDSVTGKKVKTTLSARTKRELEQKARRKVLYFEKAGSTVHKAVAVRTYKELADLWLDNYQHTVKPQSHATTRIQVYYHLIPAFGQLKLDKITPQLIQSYINTLPPKYVRYKLINSINRRILQYGVILRLLETNPARDVILPKRQKEGRKQVKFIAPDDLKQFLAHSEKLSKTSYKSFYWFTVFCLLLATGCRIGELAALDWSDIDLEAGTITISKSYSLELDLIGDTKTKAGTRTISIDTKTVLMLKQYKNRQRLIFLEVGSPAPTAVFSTPTNDRLRRDNAQRTIDKYCKVLAIPRFTCHAFRHTHASLLLNAGISYKELQYRLGHANISMTLDVYSHLSQDKEKEAVTYYEKALSGL